MSDDPKTIISQTYDSIAEWYLHYASTQPSHRQKYATKLLSSSPPCPHILELGCGPGVPITRMLLDQGARVTANDISAIQLQMANERCPEASFMAGDMASLSFEPESFDGIVCFFTIFHLPRGEQRAMLEKMRKWLRPGGTLVLNFATVDEEEIYGEMMGHGMFWSSFDEERSKEMVREAGLEVLEAEVLDAGDGNLEEGDADYGVKFLWVVARKENL